MINSAEELKRWVLELTGVPVVHLSELKNGHVFALLGQRLRKQRFPISKIRTDCKTEYECLNNLRAFKDFMHKDKQHSMISVQMASIAKGRLKDIIELLTWFKRSIAKPNKARTREESLPKNKSLFIRASAAKEGSPMAKHVQSRLTNEEDQIIDVLACKIKQITFQLQNCQDRDSLLHRVSMIMGASQQVL